MTLTETFITALKVLKQNKVRSFLTMLGVIIGVFAVVMLVSLVRGVQNYIQAQFDAIGSNLVFVMPGRAGFANDPALNFTNNRLSIKNTETIKKYVGDSLEGVTASIFVSKNIEYKSKDYYGAVEGTDYTHEHLMNLDLAQGKFFTKSDVDTSARVAVIGHNVNKELFGSVSPVGRRIKVDGKTFEVVGLLKQKTQDLDQEIIIPYTSMKSALNIEQVSYLLAKVKDGQDVDAALKEIEIALLKDLKIDEFTVMSQKELLNSIKNILGVLSLGLGAVAGISLLVGGIGVMNIMLVSVTERISEIGLRKALGATSKNIGIQFLLESLLLSVTGGSIGLGFGYLATYLVQSLIKAQVPWWTSLLALGFSVVVGVVFGTYPAIRASKLDPIEALRYE